MVRLVRLLLVGSLLQSQFVVGRRQQQKQQQKQNPPEVKRDYYKVLGVKRNAPADAIKSAYKEMAKKTHPDKAPQGTDPKIANARFQQVAEAYEHLSDPVKRRRYDQVGFTDARGRPTNSKTRQTRQQQNFNFGRKTKSTRKRKPAPPPPPPKPKIPPEVASVTGASSHVPRVERDVPEGSSHERPSPIRAGTRSAGSRA